MKITITTNGNVMLLNVGNNTTIAIESTIPLSVYLDNETVIECTGENASTLDIAPCPDCLMRGNDV